MEVFQETGFTSETVLAEKIDSHDGSLNQQALMDTTGWTAGAISRLLLEMEDAGSIERVWFGREKMITHPGA